MIVHDLDIRCARWRPTEADPELIVHSDAMLPFAVTLECLESIPRWNAKILKPPRDLQLSQLTPGHGLNLLESPDPLTTRERLRVCAPERQ
jgi:hypothetical protein